MILLNILLLLFGFYILIKGADLTIDSARYLAKKFGISPLIIGLTVIAFGTSLPELSVSLISSITAKLNDLPSDIAVGNIIGSNIANLTLVLGFSAVYVKFKIQKKILKFDFPFLILISILFLVFLSQFDSTLVINRIEGFMLLLLFFVYLILKSKDTTEFSVEEKIVNDKLIVPKLLFGFLLVSLGGYLITANSELLSQRILIDIFNLNKNEALAFTGLTVVAFGTSIPELVTSIVAVKKGQSDMAIGNIVGSNIFNILLVLGLSSSIVTLQIQNVFIFDTLISLIITLVIFALLFFKSSKYFYKYKLLLIFTYFIYLIYLILRSL
tara:strand:+ start:8392 stop:9372 length:981 start_codon:yes stop_codon:yes gene_type:complete